MEYREMLVELRASLSTSEELKSPYARIRIVPIIPLALTAAVIEGATFEKLTPEGTAQLSRCHHTETSGKEEDDDDENPHT